MCKGFQPNSLLAIRFVFAVCLELVLFYVFIVYFWDFFRVDHVVLCSVQGIGNTAGLEGFDDHAWGIPAHASLIHLRTRFLLGAFFFPAGVNSNGPGVIHAKYFRRTLSLNGLFRHLSKGCTTGVRPPGITATSMFRCFRSSFTESDFQGLGL